MTRIDVQPIDRSRIKGPSFAIRSLCPHSDKDRQASWSAGATVIVMRLDARSDAVAFYPQFQCAPIGVWVQQGPNPPPFQRP